MFKDESGGIIVEASISFVIFVGFLASLISLINIITLYARVEFAVVQIATEVQGYTYILDRSSFYETHDNFKDVMEDDSELVVSVFDAIGEISNTDVMDSSFDVSDLQENVDTIVDAVLTPYDLFKSFVKYTVNEGESMLSSFITETILKSMMKRYLEVQNMSFSTSKSANDYLLSKAVIDGINGIDFSSSSLVDDDRIIKIVAKYDIEHRFALFPVPINVSLVNSASARCFIGN